MSTEHATANQLHLAEWQDRLQDVIDQALSAGETLQVHAHIASCTMCTMEHRRLLAIDARLRSEFAVAAPSADFDQRLFANIASWEHDKRTLARQREQQEYAARLAQLRGSWRGLLRFELGNVIGGIATAVAVGMATASAWPTLNSSVNSAMGKSWLGAQQPTWLPQGFTSLLSDSSGLVSAVLASLTIAAAAIWFMQRADRAN